MDVVTQIEEAFVAHWSVFGRWPKGELRDQRGVLWFETPIKHLPYNGVIRTHVEGDAEAAISAVLERFGARNVQFFWLVYPSAQPTLAGPPGIAAIYDSSASSAGAAANQAPPRLESGGLERCRRKPSGPLEVGMSHLRLVQRVAALLAVTLLTGCSSERPTSKAGPLVVAPPQRIPLIVAVRSRAGKPPTFNPPRFDLVTLRVDASKLRVLVHAPAGALRRLESPAWSPDAERVYFVGISGKREGSGFLYSDGDAFVVAAAGGRPRRVTTFRDVRAVVLSPDGRTLLLERDEHPGTFPSSLGLWLIDGDGRNKRRLLDQENGVWDMAGSWSPDGRTIAFTRCRFEPPDDSGFIANACGVYIVSRDGSGLHKLADRSSDPTFSPDGRLIAFVSDRDENGRYGTGSDEEMWANELYVMEPNGDHRRRLTQSEGLDERTPAWSPDGSRIAYAREGPARFVDQLMLVPADGTCARLVIGDASDSTVHAASFESPAWRPGRVTGKFAPPCRRR